MTIRSIGEHRRRRSMEDGDVSSLALEPIGSFSSRVTRDANAIERNGESVFAMNDVPSGCASTETIEIMFADGTWMLCDSQELMPLQRSES